MSDLRHVIDMRLARGEISIEEHRKLLDAVGQSAGPDQTTTQNSSPAGEASPQPVPLASALQPAGDAASVPPKWIKNLGFGALGVVGFFVAGSFFGGPVCKLNGLTVTPDTFFVNGVFDAGYTAQADITNTGNARILKITSTLSTSEGEFRRQRNVHFADNGIQRVVFQFHEPTLNSANVQAIFRCEK